jgi:spore coat polysaccharide biosynthesis protein SpsF
MNGIHLMPNIYAFIQARSTSSRLPQKVLKTFSENPNLTILDHIYLRLLYVLPKERIIFLIPYSDTVLIEYCTLKSYLFFEGDEQNVRERYLSAALSFGADKIIRVTGDNPFLDILYVEMLVECLLTTDLDLVSFYGLPIGMGAEAFKLSAIQLAPPGGFLDHHNEHVSLHVKEFPNHYKIKKLKPFLNSSQLKLTNQIRVTIDEKEDFDVCKNIYLEMETNPFFGANELIELFSKKPDLFQLNKSISQISFSLPKIEEETTQPKINILYADPKHHGSGHLERCKILFVLLQSNGYDVEISKASPSELNSDLFIIDQRDEEVPEILKHKKILLLDNFGVDHNKYPTFYSLPNPKLKMNRIKEHILIPKSISLIPKMKESNPKTLLIYAGNLDFQSCEILDSYFLKYYGNYEITRIGGAIPVSKSIFWISRLPRSTFYLKLGTSSIFASYFGQGVLEAAYLNKELILFSISDYHNTLSEYFEEYYSLTNIGYINSLKEPILKKISQNLELQPTGYEILIQLIHTLIYS